jgi:hypothetical protein
VYHLKIIYWEIFVLTNIVKNLSGFRYLKISSNFSYETFFYVFDFWGCVPWTRVLGNIHKIYFVGIVHKFARFVLICDWSKNFTLTFKKIWIICPWTWMRIRAWKKDWYRKITTRHICGFERTCDIQNNKIIIKILFSVFFEFNLNFRWY